MPGYAAIYTPDSVNSVLLELPESIVALTKSNRKTKPTGLHYETNETDSFSRSLIRARRYIVIAKTEQEPRWYGFAEAELLPFWDKSHKHEELALLIASILQHQHRFPEALIELNQVLEKNPRNTQALVDRAQVKIMLALFEQAQQDCQALFLIGDPISGANCLAQVKGLTGSGSDALEIIKKTLNQNISITKEQKFELHLSAAVIAHRERQPSTAYLHYNAAFKLRPNHHYLLRNYCDLLLEEQQPQTVISLLDPTSDNLELQIVRARAQIMLDPAVSTALINKISSVFNQGHILESDFPHKEYAYYTLHVLSDLKQALRAALSNWNIQKDPASARLLLNAAVAANQIHYAERVIDFIEMSGLYDYRIERILNNLPKTGKSV